MISQVSKACIFQWNSLSHRIKEGPGEESPLIYDFFPEHRHLLIIRSFLSSLGGTKKAHVNRIF